jgi:hypothetical protein
MSLALLVSWAFLLPLNPAAGGERIFLHQFGRLAENLPQSG